MIIQYLSKEAINDIKDHFDKYKDHFTDETNQWFIDEFNKSGWIKNSKIEVDDFDLDYDSDYDVSDRRNIEILYDSLKGLPPSLAADERIWSGLLFTKFWKYVKYRRKDDILSGDKFKILSSFFFMRGSRRSCYINCLSRLWWAGFLLYDEKNDNHYFAVNLLAESAFASKLMLFSSSNFTSNKDLTLGIFDCLCSRAKLGDKIGRYHYVDGAKYLNSLGGSFLLDTLTRKEVCSLYNEVLNKKYGVYNL